MSLSKEDSFVIAQLQQEEDITDTKIKELKEKLDSSNLSVYWEIKILFGLGISLFSLGILNIIIEYYDHYLRWILLGILLLAFLATAYYCFTRREPFSWEETVQKAKFFDITLIACTTFFLSLEGYVQYEFKLFGDRYNDIAIITTLFYFFCAYYFDNRVVLTKGLIAFTAWFAIEFNVLSWDNLGSIDQKIPVAESIIIGVGALVVGYVTSWKNWKRHFNKTYLIFATQLIMLALTAEIVSEKNPDPLFYVLIVFFGISFYFLSKKVKSPLVLTTTLIYLYITTTVFLKVFDWDSKYWRALYFICTALVVIGYFINKRKTYEES